MQPRMESCRRMGMSRARSGDESPNTPTNITMVNSRNASAQRCMSGMNHVHHTPVTFVETPNQYSATSPSAAQ